MSEPNNSGFPFTEMTGDGLDIASIFGGASGGTTPSSVNPFEAALAQQAPPAAPTAQAQPQTAAPQPAPQAAPQPAAPVFQTVQPVPPAPAPAPVPAAQPVTPAPQPPLDIDPLAAAMAQQEAKAEQKAAKSLFEKAPVFC